MSGENLHLLTMIATLPLLKSLAKDSGTGRPPLHLQRAGRRHRGRDLIAHVPAASGAEAQFAIDGSHISRLVATDTRTSRRTCGRFGRCVPAAAKILQDCIAAVPWRLASYRALLALLEQNKTLDDSGTQRTLPSGEAAVVMLLSAASSYGPDDTPDSGCLLLAFLLTLRFATNFNFAAMSVTIGGMRPPVNKQRREAQPDIVDTQATAPPT